PSACRSITTPSGATLAVQLTGVDVAAQGSLGDAWVSNFCLGGWHVDAAVTRFTAGTQTLPTTALSVSGVTVQVVGGSAPVNSTTYPVTLTADAAATRIFTSTASSGSGTFVLTPQLRLVVPADTYAASYAASVTLTLAAG